MADSLQDERIQYDAALKALLDNLGGEIGSGTITDPTRMGAINYIKAKLDELVPEGEGITFNLSTDPNISDPLNLLISAHLDEGVKDVCLSAPLSVLFPTALAGEGVHTGDAKTGYIILPGSFLRLSSVRMEDWERDGTLTTPETALGKRQGNRWLMGGPSKPVAVLDWKSIDSVMKRVIKYYSVDDSHAIDKLFYIPEQTAEAFLIVNPNLMDALAWMVAGKIMQITGMKEEAKMAQERVAQAYLNL